VASQEKLVEAPPVLATLARLPCDSAPSRKRTDRSPRLPADLRARMQLKPIAGVTRVDRHTQGCVFKCTAG